MLPLLTVVWAAMPGLACCQAIAASGTGDRAGLEATHVAHAATERAAPSDADRGINYDDQRADSEVSADPVQDADNQTPSAPCPDVDKNHYEARSAASVDLAHVVLVSFLPISTGLAERVDPPSEPPPPIQRRPLHLSKSVLLI